MLTAGLYAAPGDFLRACKDAEAAVTVDPTFTKGASVAVLKATPCPSVLAEARRHTWPPSPGVSLLALRKGDSPPVQRVFTLATHATSCPAAAEPVGRRRGGASPPPGPSSSEPGQTESVSGRIITARPSRCDAAPQEADARARRLVSAGHVADQLAPAG